MTQDLQQLTESMPDSFWLSIRHISSFKNAKEYNEYLTLKIQEWQKKESFQKRESYNGETL